jgi:hypothetical protein
MEAPWQSLLLESPDALSGSTHAICAGRAHCAGAIPGGPSLAGTDFNTLRLRLRKAAICVIEKARVVALTVRRCGHVGRDRI